MVGNGALEEVNLGEVVPWAAEVDCVLIVAFNQWA